jgi:hypothetical protein
MPKGELPSEKTVETDISKVEVELSTEVKELEFLREFISNNIRESSEDSEVVELSEEERKELFFAPEIEFSKAIVEERKMNIEKSPYEIVSLDKPSAENNLVIKQENIVEELREEYSRRKEPKNLFEKYNLAVYKNKRVKRLERKLYGNSKEKAKQLEERLWENYPELVQSGKTGIEAIGEVYSNLESDFEKKGKNKEEVRDITLKACSRLLPFYEKGVIDEIFVYEDSHRESILYIAQASEDRWEDLLTTLKGIPHFNIGAKSSVDTIAGILNNGLDKDVVEYLNTLSKEGMLVEKTDYKSPEERRENLVSTILEENLDKEKLFQNTRKANHYGSQGDWNCGLPKSNLDEGGVFRLNMLRYGVDINKVHSKRVKSYHDFLYQDVQAYKGASPEDKVNLAQVLDQKFRIVLELEKYAKSNPSEADVESVLSFIQQEENKGIIEKASLYQENLGMESNWLHRHGVPSLSAIETNFNAVEESLISASKRIDSGLDISDKDALKELLAMGDENIFATMRVLKYMDYYFPRDKDITREEFKEMVLVDDGKYHFTEKAFEFLYDSEYSLEQALKGPWYPNHFEVDTIENFKDTNARKFWTFVRGMKEDPGTAGSMLKLLEEGNYEYKTFVGKYISEIEGENFLNEKFYKDLLKISLREDQDPYYYSYGVTVPVRQEDIEKFKDDYAIAFWSLVRGVREHRGLEAQALGILKLEDYKYESFVKKYTSKTEGEIFLNEVFYRGLIEKKLRDSREDDYHSSPDEIKVSIRPEDISNFNLLDEETLILFCRYGTGFISNMEGQVLSDQFIQSLETENAKDFWTFFRDVDNNQIRQYMFENLGVKDSQDGIYQVFIDTYTTLVEYPTGSRRLLNEEFLLKIINEGSTMGQLTIKGVSFLELFDLDPLKKEVWSRYIETSDPVVKKSLITFYKTKGEDFTEAYIEVFFRLIEKIEESPSKEINRIKDQIIAQLSSTIEGGIDEIIEQYDILENLFVRNNSPVSVLRYKVFDKLFSDKLLKHNPVGGMKISRIFSDILSDVNLEEVDKRGNIMGLIRKDLLKVAKDSVDENFYNFMVSLRDGIAAIDFYDKYIQEGFSDEELIEALGEDGREFIMKSLDIFFTTSDFLSESEEISSRIVELRQFLGVPKSEQLVDGIYSFYLEPLNVPRSEDLSEVIDTVILDMEKTMKQAHERGLYYYENGLSVASGDLVKAVKSKYFSQILGSGVLAQDFLGASANQDVTPYDTDTQMILDTQEGISVAGIIRDNTASAFGDVSLVFRNRGQFVNPGDLGATEIDPNKYELIHSGGISDRHYGIRTGIASTEIDFIYCEKGKDRTLQQIKFEVAKMGVYIPILDSENNIVFTPEDFKRQRATFSGLHGLKGQEFEVNLENSFKEVKKSLDVINGELQKSWDRITFLNDIVESEIKTILQSKGFLFETTRTGLEGLRVENVGSTSRLTHVPGVSDFDFSVLMDRQQLESFKKGNPEEVIQNIMGSIGEVTSGGKIFETPDGGIQLVGSEIVLRDSGESIEFDLGITDKKDNLDQSNTHNRIIERLGNIKTNSGEKAYKFVLSNIVFAKKFLKEHGCYKKASKEGGLGGVGVENWILQHNGSFEEAALSFLKASTTETGEERDFVHFQREYTVWDAGKDLRTGKHDEFVSQNMTAEGYKRMRGAIQELVGNKVAN